MTTSATDKPDTNATPSPNAQGDRLPCRGCLPSCKNYATCEGKPWRLFQPAQRP